MRGGTPQAVSRSYGRAPERPRMWLAQFRPGGSPRAARRRAFAGDADDADDADGDGSGDGNGNGDGDGDGGADDERSGDDESCADAPALLRAGGRSGDTEDGVEGTEDRQQEGVEIDDMRDGEAVQNDVVVSEVLQSLLHFPFFLVSVAAFGSFSAVASVSWFDPAGASLVCGGEGEGGIKRDAL